MFQFKSNVFLLAASALIAAVVAVPEPYDQEFSGDATYYGVTPNGAGNCAIRDPLPSMYDGMIPMALNNAQYNSEQYGDSYMCGACVEGHGSGNGEGGDPVSGPFKGYITDRCPECAFGDLDFAADGDGRWDITWNFVPCEGGGDPTFVFEGSNAHYWKIQPRGGKAPVKKVWVNGVKATRTQDNFFIVQAGPYYGEQLVKTKTLLQKRKKELVASS